MTSRYEIIENVFNLFFSLPDKSATWCKFSYTEKKATSSFDNIQVWNDEHFTIVEIFESKCKRNGRATEIHNKNLTIKAPILTKYYISMSILCTLAPVISFPQSQTPTRKGNWGKLMTQRKWKKLCIGRVNFSYWDLAMGDLKIELKYERPKDSENRETCRKQTQKYQKFEREEGNVLRMRELIG